MAVPLEWIIIICQEPTLVNYLVLLIIKAICYYKILLLSCWPHQPFFSRGNSPLLLNLLKNFRLLEEFNKFSHFITPSQYHFHITLDIIYLSAVPLLRAFLDVTLNINLWFSNIGNRYSRVGLVRLIRSFSQFNCIV